MPDDSPNIDDLSFDDKIAILEEDLPEAVRNFIHSPERDATSFRLSQKYGLHADQASAFERAYLYMLLGVNSPDEFIQDLKEAGVAPDTIRGLTNDVNEQVFKRLRDEERQPSAPTRPVPLPDVPVMQVASATPPPPAPQVPAYNLARTDTVVSAPMPVIRTMHTDMELIQHPDTAIAVPPQHEIMSTIPNPAHVTPARSFQTASVPYTSMPTASNPVPQNPSPRPTLPSATIPAAPPNNPTFQAPPIGNTYSGDPYREPIS